ncbi:uncharacterized protein LOC112055705 [Bicyclus anynana]|uniref:Uncharacterized protein LOC112055705 n=1 Tax=Bicyclus anynana TaxID=110368 RepID=A0ABM3LX06_BICAN|nr:uncharacterized protein LOC112055705 [Bicyclus anynana]
MSGKSYTMKEMKAIVEYLTEHRAYGEIKGRKMWMDLASSNITTRTWQSLKETFLKRILPDIHNPYYRLSVTQISSFQQGQDIEKRLNNRLEIRSTSRNSDNEGVKEKDTKKPENENGINKDMAGEDSKQLHLRASTETLVLENCYETAEEIIKDLQSQGDNEAEDKESQPTKSLRELITYSDPLTPMLQSVIDDFATDDEDSESRMQIVEPEDIPDKNNETTTNNETIEISDSEGNDLQGETNHKQTDKPDADQSSPNTKDQKSVTSNSKETEANNENSTTLPTEINGTNNSKDSSAVNIGEDGTKDINNLEDNSAVKIGEEDNSKRSSEVTQNNSADTLLPGNQEAFEEKIKDKSDENNKSLNRKLSLRKGRKRANSQDLETKNKKRLISKVKSISDTEKFNSTIGKDFNISKLNKSAPEDKHETPINMDTEKCDSVEELVAENTQNTVTQNPVQIQNPCLNNVNLYAEQFSTEKYIDSDENRKKEDKTDKDQKIKNIDNEIKNSQDISKIQINKDNKTKKIVNEKSVNKNTDNDNNMNKNENNENMTKITVNNEKTKATIHEHKINKKNSKEQDKENSAAILTSDQENENVVTLNHSDSASEGINDVNTGRDRFARIQRDRTLANKFGFATGGTAIRRPRRSTNRRRRNTSHSHSRAFHMSSESSDWTSNTSSEYVSSPPRKKGPKGRYTRKYLKPGSARILSLQEEGGLFVMCGKKIYPVVKHGKIVKNYTSYMAEDDVDHEESFWKLKYVEEKKRTAELTKLLNEAKENRKGPCVEEPSRVLPVLPATTENNDDCITISDDTVQQEVVKLPSVAVPAEVVRPVPAPNPTVDEKTVKIKFIKMNEEVQLEGHWSQLNPMLAQVAQLFQKEPTPSTITSKTDLAAEPMVQDGKCTPIEEVVEKVNRREKEIAEEIERLDKEEISASEGVREIQKQNNYRKRVTEVITTDNEIVGVMERHREETPASVSSVSTQNITKRKGRPRKVSPALTPSPAKKTKVDVVTEENGTAEQTTAEENGRPVRARRTKATKTLNSDTDQSDRTYIVNTRKSTPRQYTPRKSTPRKTDIVVDEDENILYKFPPHSVSTRKSNTNKPTVNAMENTDRRKSKRATKILSLAENITNSMEKTHNDINNSRICMKNGKETGITIPSEGHCSTHLQHTPNLNITEDLSESSNSFQIDHIESMTFQNSSVESESYRMLMNKKPLHIKNTSKLEKIREVDLAANLDTNEDVFNEITNSGNADLNNKENLDILQVDIDNENSSNVSLPTSPVLSIVENISISKNLLSSMDLEEYAISDKPEDIDGDEQIMLNGLMTPNADVSMALMEQECGIEKVCDDGQAYHYNLSNFKDPAISDSLLKKINTINIDDPTASDSLSVKLRNLILESTKKKLRRVSIDTENIKGKSAPKGAKSKKRSSTPRKKQRKQTITEPQIVVEHTETCSQRGRESCPPIIIVSEHKNNEMINAPVTESSHHLTAKPSRRNKKKDTIKVKILKPKTKAKANSCEEIHKADFTDSGINATVSEIKLSSDDSVEYIHNHSDTCLNAHECMGDSVQIVDNTANSILSLDTNSAYSDIACHVSRGNLMHDLCSNDNQDGLDVTKEFNFAEIRQADSATTTAYHTPIGSQSPPISIMTDDLSVGTPEEPVRNSNWYLLSEQESSSSNYFNVNDNSESRYTNFAPLDQIFPITCAVPNLSTITENSKDNGYDVKK